MKNCYKSLNTVFIYLEKSHINFDSFKHIVQPINLSIIQICFIKEFIIYELDILKLRINFNDNKKISHYFSLDDDYLKNQ